MSRFLTRAQVWALVVLCGCAPLALGQTVELVTGQGRFVDIPGNTVGFQPGAMAIAADGYLYTNDINGKLMRLNTTTGAVTALPATPGGLNLDLGWSWGIAVNAAGIPHVTSQGGLYRINADGTLTRIRDLSSTGPMAFGADGTIYMVPGDNRVYAHRPNGAVDVIAGGEEAGFAGDGGPATAALLAHPQGIAVGADGNVYVADTDNNRIRKVDLVTGTITTIAGTGGGSYAGEGVPAAQADIGGPLAIAVDAAGNLYVGSTGARRVLRIDAASTLVTTVVGNGSASMSGDGGPASAAGVSWPQFVAVDSYSNVFFADSDSYKYIRKVDAATGIVSRALGFASMYFCGENVPANQGCLAQPLGVDIDRSSGNVDINDAALMRLRRISGNTVSTLATVSDTPWGMDHDQAGNLYVMGGGKVTRYDRLTGAVTVVAGGNGPGFAGDGGPATAARLGSIGDVAVDTAGNLFISDSNNNRIRKVTASTGIINSLATLTNPTTLELDSVGQLYISEGCRLHRMNVNPNGDGIARPYAGTAACATQDPVGGTQPNSTPLGSTRAFAIDPVSNNMYLAWSNKLYRIRNNVLSVDLIRSPPQGWVTAEGVKFDRPSGMSVDATGRLYISQESKPYLFRVTGLNDNTPPVVTVNVVGRKGIGIWYSSDVTVTFTVSDPESYVVTTGCQGGTVTTDTPTKFDSTTFECQATSLGGLSWRGESVRRDTVPPTLTWGTPTPAPDANGWNYGDVSIPLVPADALSGLNTWPQSPQVINGEGTGLTRTVTVTDMAGNVATFTSPPVNINRSAGIQEQITGTVGNNGWYRSNVQLSWIITNAPNVTSSSGCGSTVVSADTAGTTFTCTVTTPNGTTSKSVTIKRDTTPPSISFGAFSPLPNADGWNGSAVNVPYTATDATSGIAGAIPASPLAFTQTGAGQSRQVDITDVAGNVASFQSPAVNIDQTPPTVEVSVTGPLGNAGWYRGEVNIHFTITSPLSPERHSGGCLDAMINGGTAGVTFSCLATNAAGSTTKAVTIKNDPDSPMVTFGAASPAPDEAGWRPAPTSVPYTVTDTMSGVASSSSPSPLAITQTSATATGEVTVTDVAGNSATYTTPAYKVDGTPPVVDYFIYGLQSGDGSGWYRTDAHVVFTAIDAQGSLSTKQGDCDVTLTTDTAGITYTCTGTSAGGTASKSVTLKRDTTPPMLTWGAPTTQPNAAGWYTGDVLIPYTMSDATAGISPYDLDHSNPYIVGYTGRGVSAPLTLHDRAGNEATFLTPPVNIDRGPPSIAPNITGTPGLHGWYASDVSVSWSIVKVPAENLLSQSACDGGTVTQDTAGVTFTCSATSGAGTTNASVTIKRDATAPVITFGTPSPAPNTNGWNKTNVTIPFTINEPTSGIDTWSHNSPMLIGTEGAGVSELVWVTDQAGNRTEIPSPPRNIDKTAPVVTFNSPADGETYGFYQDVVADYTCTDTSLLSCTAPTPDGELVNTKTAGARTFKVTAKDAVNFTTAITHAFNVESLFNFDAFLAPASAPPTLNLVTRGALVPIRWQLPDGQGGFVTNPASFSSATVGTLTCGSATVVPLNDTSGAPAGISFDAASNSFIYNWQTSSSWTGCRKLTIKLKDNSLHELRFKFQ